MSETQSYMPRLKGLARWTISQRINGEWVHLIQNTSVENPDDPEKILHALGIEPTPQNLDRHFPFRHSGAERKWERCPTLKLINLFANLGSTRGEVGV